MAIKFTDAETKKDEDFLTGHQWTKEQVTAAKAMQKPLIVTNKKPGRKPSGNAKKLLTLRLDPDVVEFYRSGGEGWQTRINEILRKNAGL